MKVVSILEVVKIDNRSVNKFIDKKKYVATGDVYENLINSYTDVSYEDRPSRANIQVRQGHVIFARMQGTKKVLTIDESNENYIYSTGFCVFEPSDQILTDYLKLILNSDLFQNQKDKYSKGATQKAINNEDIKKIQIPLPSLEEQNKIIEVLDKAQELIDARKEQIKLMNELIQSVFFEMFGDPLSNSKRWKTTSLGNVSKLERGRFSPRPRNDPQYFGGKYPYIQTGDISKSDNRLNSYTQTLNEKGEAVSKKFVAGTIVIAIVGATIGATALLCIDVYAPDSIIGISVDDTVCNNIFLEMQLRCMRQWLLDIAPEGARANINLRILSQLRLIAPPIDKQREFAEIVHVIEEQKKEIGQRLEDLIVLKNSLEKTLFPKE